MACRGALHIRLSLHGPHPRCIKSLLISNLILNKILSLDLITPIAIVMVNGKQLPGYG